MPPTSLDTSIDHLLHLLVPKFHSHKQQQIHPSPIILGITGLQGSGKSTWAGKIVSQLTSKHNLHAITVSLDDFYHTHSDLVARRDRDPGNKLYATRGQPGTHDQQLARDTLDALRSWDDSDPSYSVDIPVFDKSRFDGAGDRAPREEWPKCTTKPDVVVFEGWCVGFQALSELDLERKVQTAKEMSVDSSPESITTLQDHSVSHLLEINRYLKEYNEAFMGASHFDFFVHLDTRDLRNVYRWRAQQERALWEVKGEGMSEEGVRAFVRGYVPAYELYLGGLREGLFGVGSGRHVRVVLDRERGVEEVEVI